MDEANLIAWLLQHWDTVVLVILVADKVVAVTKNPYDDLILTIIKGVLKPFGSLLSSKKDDEDKKKKNN